MLVLLSIYDSTAMSSHLRVVPARGLAVVPLTARTHQLYLRTQEVPPYYTQKNEYPLLAGTHHSWRLTCGPTKLTRTKGLVNLVNMNDSSSNDRTISIQWP